MHAVKISVTGIPNTLLVACGDSFTIIQHVQLQFADHLKQLLHAAINNEWYEVVKKLISQEYLKELLHDTLNLLP